MEVCKKPHRFAGREYLYSWYKPGGEVMRCEAPLVGIDTETHLIENRYEVPLGVVAGLCSGRQVQLVMWTEWEEYFPKFLRLNPTVKLVFFNGPFDMKVIGEKIFIPELAKDNRVMELRASYRQTRIATQGWFPSSTTLASITKEVTGVELDKESGVRTSYLRGNDITEAQEHYLCDDAIATYTCGCTFNNTPTESLQARASWVLAEVSRNGMFVDLPYVREQVAKVSKEMEELVATLKTFGFTIKDAVEDLTQVQRVIRIFDLFGMDISLQMKNAGIKTIPRNWLIVACATMYNAIRRGGVMPSDLTGNLRQLLKVILDPPPKCAASESFFDSFREVLTRRLKKLDCIECLEGCGNAKMRSNTPLLIFLEKLAELFKQGKLFDSMKPFDDAFRELHEENYGWLPTAPKKLAPLAFLQKHLDEMMAQHEDLKFPYTPAAKKAIRKRMREAKRNALPGEPITVDVSDLEKFQIKAFDMWILSDAGLTDPFLEAYFRYKHHEKLLSTYITEKYVEKDGRVHPRFETLLRTGRTSCSSPNLQNMPREDGLREMYKAPEGKCLVSSDYGQQELVVLAYTLKKRYGKSVMYNLINAGLDLHGTFSLYRDGKLGGMDLHNLTNEDVRKIKEMCKPYKEVKELKRSRQLSKCANFGKN